MSVVYTCNQIRCNEPAVGNTPARFWAQCVTHAVEYADRDLARAQAARDSLRTHEAQVPGQLDLLGSVG